MQSGGEEISKEKQVYKEKYKDERKQQAEEKVRDRGTYTN